MISCIIKKHRLSKSEKFDHQYLNPLNLAAIMLININCKGEFAICLPQARGGFGGLRLRRAQSND